MTEEAKKVVSDAAGAKKEEPAAPEVGQMKRGDYMIHVFIEQARQLKVPEGNTVDPIVEVSCMNVKKFTSAKDDIGATGLCSWNEHLFFEPKNQTQEAMEQAKISIKILDKGYFKDAMIGLYEFDIAYIYFMKDHSLMHKWLAMSNPSSETFNEVTGYLKISITIAGTGDEQVQITPDSSTNSDDAVMMPPSIRPEYYQLKFKFFRAEKLPSMDTNLFGKGGSIDAYIICNYMNKKIKTEVKTQKEGGYIDWDQEFLSRIVMKLFDEDKISDEIVGSLLFNIKECMNEKNGKFFWKNVYGSPLGCSGENTNLMNASPESASTWKGRILMSVTAEKTDKPVLLVQRVSEADKEKAAQYLQEHEFEVIAEVGQGIALPSSGVGVGGISIGSNEKYSVMIKVGDLELKTEKAVFAENTYNRWNFRFKQTTFKAPYQDVYDIGRAYVYLMSGDKPICYYTAPIEEFLDPNPKFKWVELINDLAIGKVTETHKAGLLSIKLAIHDKTKNGPMAYDQFDAWKKPPQKRLGAFKVRAFIFQCRDLPAADTDGQSDPYITIWDSSKDIKKTRVIEDNLNPLFYQTLELSFEANSVKEFPPFVLDVYDWDTIGDDFLSRTIIPIKEAKYSTNDDVPEPKWHSCHLKPGAPMCGEILISFSVVEEDYTYKIPLNYMNIKENVVFQEFVVNINILGLRDLQSVGLLPVKKAFIVFNLKSLVPPDEGAALDNLKTQPSDAGPNPTINTLLKFRIPLPVDPLYCPRLACSVYDYIFKGFNQPMIGSFIIPVGELVFKLRKEREEETAAIEYINQELDKILAGEGIMSYSLQEESKESSEDFEIASQRSMSKVVNSKLVSSVKNADTEMKIPLLHGIQDQFILHENRQMRAGSNLATPSRITPQNVQSKSREGTTKNVKGNALKIGNFDKFNSGMKDQLLKDQKEVTERAKRELEDMRQREQQQFKLQHEGAVKNVISSQYKLDTRLNVHREVNAPPESLFIGLGWDKDPEQKKKHYRRFYPDELENVKEVMPQASPFDQWDIKKGQSRGASKGWGFFTSHKEDDSGAVSTEQIMGRFKGIVTVESEQDLQEYQEKKAELIHDLKKKLNLLALKKTKKPVVLRLDKLDTMEGRVKFEHEIENLGIQHLEITRHLADLESDETLHRMLLTQTKCIIRLYMISGYDLASRDNGSFSDPYLKITCGNKVYNERDNYLEDEPNPEFNKYFDFESTFPGCPPIVIDVVDYDAIFGDDSIGTTKIDLEDRFFSPEWQSIKNKPIEYRQLYHPSSSVSQGVIKCWVEIHPTSIPINTIPIYDLTSKPHEEFEVRVVIWDTRDVVAMDIEGTNDMYCRAFFDSKEEVHETDTHYRCQNGKGSFNYRLIFTVKHPRKDYSLTLQLYDRDFFKSNDIIGDALIDLKLPFDDASLSGRTLGLKKTYFNAYLKEKGYKFDYKDEGSFWIPIKGKDDKTGEIVENGKVRISIDIIPKAMADANKVGEARQEPNHSPFLPPPVGRLSFSLNPWKMFQQLVPPAIRRKIYLYTCLAICCVLCVMLAPFIFGNVISALITKGIGIS